MGWRRGMAGVAACGLALAACAGTPKTSTLTGDDLAASSDEMAAQLSGSDFLKDRGPDSEPIVVAIDKVQNLTSDIIPEGQQWWMVSRVRDKLNVSALRQQRNVRFVIPQQFLREGMERGNLDGGGTRTPTHEMSATFRSLTRAAGKDRTDAYVCEYRLTQIGSGELKWTGEFAFKRVASGRSYD